MPEATHLQTNFTAGEISPRMLGRTDLDKYPNALAYQSNFLTQPQGGIVRRPGTVYAATTRNADPAAWSATTTYSTGNLVVYNGTTYSCAASSTGNVPPNLTYWTPLGSIARLVPFQFSTVQSYQIEFGDGYCRFYRSSAQLEISPAAAYNGGTAYVPTNLVSSAGVNYYCIAATTGNAPPNPTYWYPLAGNVYEIPSPYAAADLPNLKWTQSADILFICHPNYQPYELRRQGDVQWQFVLHPCNNGPYIDVNATAIALTPSGEGGSVTITAGYLPWNAATNYIVGSIVSLAGTNYICILANVGTTPPNATYWTVYTVGISVFAATDVGRLVTIQQNTALDNDGVPFADGTGQPAITWGVALITAYNSATSVTATVVTATSTTTGYPFVAKDTDLNAPSITWALGAWSNFLGWPTVCAFHQGRLWFANTASQPQTLWSTVVDDFANFSPNTVVPSVSTATTYTSPASSIVAADNACTFTLDDDHVNSIEWMVSISKGMMVLTSGAEFLLGTDALFTPITPTNVQVFRQSTFGVKPLAHPTQIGIVVLFTQIAGAKILELHYDFYNNQYLPQNLALLAEHITRATGDQGMNIVDSAYQQEPAGILWSILGDGSLVAMTYLKEQTVIAWHRHPLGGGWTSPITGPGNPVVESVSVIRDPALQEDQVWLIVKRTVNGQSVRFVEYIEQSFEQGAPLEAAYFVDAGAQADGYNGIIADTMKISGGTTWAAGDVGTVTCAGPTFNFNVDQVGRSIRFRQPGTYATYTAALITAYISTTQVSVQFTTPIPANLQNLAVYWWGVTFNKVDGLNYLEGQTVAVLADGGVQAQAVVASGSITLQSDAVVVQVGLPYTSTITTVPLVVQTPAGSSQSKRKRTWSVWLRFYETLGGQVQASNSRFPETLNFRNAEDQMDLAIPLYTGLKKARISSEHGEDAQIIVTTADPTPMTLLALTTELEVYGTD